MQLNEAPVSTWALTVQFSILVLKRFSCSSLVTSQSPKIRMPENKNVVPQMALLIFTKNKNEAKWAC